MLARRLGGPPSNGLRVVTSVASQLPNGRLPHGALFGFSMTDQLAGDGTSAHYFQNSRPCIHHKWEEECKLLDKLR